MAATTTPSISSLLATLGSRYPDLSFESADHCAWNPETGVVYYRDAANEAWRLLHEVGHALLGHRNYTRDIELLGLERDAWQRAKQLAAECGLAIPDFVAESDLDTYRDWLHARSSCVNCTQTGIQTAEREYSCPHCHASWRVNDARTCQLRRYRN